MAPSQKTGRKKIVRKDVIRLARQKLWTDIGKALDSYEKHIYGDRALTSTRVRTKPESHHYLGLRKQVEEAEDLAREGDISSVEEIEKILPPEPPKKRGGRKKSSPVSDHVRGIDEPSDLAKRMVPEARDDTDETEGRGVPSDRSPPPNPFGLGVSEEKVLILIAQSKTGMTPAQIAIKVALKKRTIQNILTALKSMQCIFKASDGKFRSTESGDRAIEGRYVKLEKGAILDELSESDRKVLFAIASKKEGVTLSAISVMVPGITKRTKQNIITALKTRELIEKSGDRFVLTAHAREELAGKLAKPLTGKKLREHLSETLPDTQAIVIDVLSESDSGAMMLSEIANVLNGRIAFRTVQNIMTALKAQELVTKRDDGRFQLSPHLKD